MQVGSPGVPPQVLVSWEVEPIRGNSPDIVFHINRSESPDLSDSEEVCGPITYTQGVNVYEYVDITVNLHSFWRRWYYQISAEDRVSGKSYSTNIKSWESNPKTFELEIIARHDFLLRYDTGTPCFALVERTAGGSHCQECYNETLGRSERSHCPVCFGTGRERPFFGPILTFIDFNPPANATVIQQQEMPIGQTNVWWSAFPKLKPRDVVVEVMSGERHRVVSVNPVGDVRTSIQHFGRLERISQRDIEHQIPIPDAIRRSAVAELERMKSERRF
jgi:hypothetical protein